LSVGDLPVGKRSVGKLSPHLNYGLEKFYNVAARSCADHLLNLDYLLGRTNRPFLTATKTFKLKRPTDFRPAKKQIFNEKKSISERTVSRAEKNFVSVELHSAKMRGLRNLLCAEKLNTSAITLQLTAQSQVEVTTQHHRKSFDDLPASTSRCRCYKNVFSVADGWPK
jgi:Menin